MPCATPAGCFSLASASQLPVVAFIAEQIGVQLGTLADYAFRENTRYEHSAALQDALGYRPFAGRPRQEIEAWLDNAAMLA